MFARFGQFVNHRCWLALKVLVCQPYIKLVHRVFEPWLLWLWPLATSWIYMLIHTLEKRQCSAVWLGHSCLDTIVLGSKKCHFLQDFIVSVVPTFNSSSKSAKWYQHAQLHKQHPGALSKRESFRKVHSGGGRCCFPTPRVDGFRDVLLWPRIVHLPTQKWSKFCCLNL